MKWLLLVLLLTLVPGLRAQSDAAAAGDARLLGADPAFRAAVQLLDAGDAAAGLRALDALAAEVQDHPEVYLWHYNRACCLALLARPEDALAALARARDAGYGLQVGQPQRLQDDPHLASLRGRPAFAALRASLEGLRAEVLERLRGPPFEWTPPDVERPPLLLVLHPFGADPEEFARQVFLPWARRQGFALLAPRGGYLLAPGRFAWALSSADFLARYRGDTRALFQAVEARRRAGRIDSDRIYVTGQGQGASLAWVLATRNPQWVRGAIAIGGGYPPSALQDWLETSARLGRRIELLHAADDSRFPLGPLSAFVARCQRQGLALRLQRYPGSGLPPDLEQRLTAALLWIDAQDS